MPSLHICTVGGNPAPIVAAIAHTRPDRVLFVVSPDSERMVPAIIDAIADAGHPLGPGARDIVRVPDAEDISACVRGMRDGLDPEVSRWRGRGPDHGVEADLTGGTKCMSAALALVVRPWEGVRLIYVGGAARTGGGLGIVVDGTERVLSDVNPWDSLGYQAVEEAVMLFDRRSLAAAARSVGDAREAASLPDLKRELATLEQCFAAYAEWDAFRHGAALRGFGNLAKNANDLRHVFGPPRAQALLAAVDGHRSFLSALVAETGPNEALVLDLVANALRRAEAGACDDAVARLYRAVEAHAQAVLRREFDLDTGRVPADRLPPALQTALRPPRQPGVYQLGLQDGYAWLAEEGHPLGRRFAELGLAAPDSPLGARNQSILAHGFAPVSERSYRELERQVLALLELGPDDPRLPRFPRFGHPHAAPPA